MAKRITEYTNIETIAESDVLPIVDVSDTEQASTGSTRKGTIATIADYIRERAETLVNKTFTNPKINEDVVLTATSTELNKITGMLDWFYPVGTIYETTSTDLDTTTKMGNHFGGTWEAYGGGRVLVGKSAETEFDTVGETGGEKAHQHRQSGMARTSSGAGGGGQVTAWNEGCYGVSGSSVSYANHGTVSLTGVNSSKTVYPWLTEEVSSLQPYIVVYRYRRTA